MKTDHCLCCQETVSPEARACPHCGQPWPTGRPAFADHRQARRHLRKHTAYGWFRALLNACLMISLLATGLYAALAWGQPVPGFNAGQWELVFAALIASLVANNALHALLDVADAALRRAEIKPHELES